jgi:hypothetical protein
LVGSFLKQIPHFIFPKQNEAFLLKLVKLIGMKNLKLHDKDQQRLLILSLILELGQIIVTLM